jgi:DNA-binding transcriptional ArsR family regulator/gas vesicle protein
MVAPDGAPVSSDTYSDSSDGLLVTTTGTAGENDTHQENDTTDTVWNTTDDAGSAVDDTVDETTEAVNDTTDTVTNTTGDAGSSVNDAVDETTDATDGAVETTTETVDSTTNGTTDDTTDTVANTTSDVTDLVDATGETVEDTTGTLADTVDDTTGTLTRTVSTAEDLDATGWTSTVTDSGDEEQFAANGTAGASGSDADSASDGDRSDAGGSNDASADGDRDDTAAVAPVADRARPRAFPGGHAGATAAAGLGALAAGILAGQPGIGTSARGAARAAASAVERIVRAVAPFRYSRYDGSDPLEHEVRSDVYDEIQAQPGSYVSAVADRADVPLSTARHHLKVLEREGLVEAAKVRGRKRLFPAYADGKELAAALADPSTADVLAALARLGPSSASALADELDLAVSTVSHHLSRLEEDALVERERDGQAVINRLPPDVADAFADDGIEAEEEPAPVGAD